MNDRIKELVSQMGWEEMGADLYGKSMDGCMTIHALEKFAELIVKECADIVYNKVTIETNEDYREGFQRARQFIWQDINKHFGIKE